jgi:TPR repeat protein
VRRTLGIVLALVVVILAGVLWRAWRVRSEQPVEHAIGVFKSGNYERALPDIRTFAERGSRAAQYTLAASYGRGLGVPVDPARAEMWFRRAECRCEAPGAGEYSLALDIAYDAAKDSDRQLAVYWLVRSAEAGDRDAQQMLADEAALRKHGLSVDAAVRDYWSRRAGATW